MKQKNNRKKRNKNKREIIFRRDKYKCLKCNSKENLTIDHIISPKIVYGYHLNFYGYNAQVLCQSCNNEKGQDIINYGSPQLEGHIRRQIDMLTQLLPQVKLQDGQNNTDSG